VLHAAGRSRLVPQICAPILSSKRNAAA
jgi:hypothetical protein